MDDYSFAECQNESLVAAWLSKEKFKSGQARYCSVVCGTI